MMNAEDKKKKQPSYNWGKMTVLEQSVGDYYDATHGPLLACVDCETDEENDDLELSVSRDEQRRLQGRALAFRHKRYYGPDDEERTCVWSGGDPFSWTEPTSGISWIGVNGTDAAVVVALAEKPSPPAGRTQLGPCDLMFTASCDMGVLADTSTAYTEFRRTLISKSSSTEVGPFSVVSAAPGTVAEDHLESIFGASPAINFVAEKLKGRSSLTYGEMKQIAVCALKYLMGSKFDPDIVLVKGSGNTCGCLHGWKMPPSEVQQHLEACSVSS